MLLSSVLMATHRHNKSCSEARFIKDGSSCGPDRVVCVDLGKPHFFGDIFHFPPSVRSPTTMLSYHPLEPETVFFSRWNRYTYSFNGFQVVNVQLKVRTVWTRFFKHYTSVKTFISILSSVFRQFISCFADISGSFGISTEWKVAFLSWWRFCLRRRQKYNVIYLRWIHCIRTTFQDLLRISVAWVQLWRVLVVSAQHTSLQKLC